MLNRIFMKAIELAKKNKWWVLAIVTLAVAVLILCLVSNSKTGNENKAKEGNLVTDDTSVLDEASETYEQVNISKVDSSYTLSEVAMCNIHEGWGLTTNNELLFTDAGVENFSVVRQFEGASSLNDGLVDICAVDRQTVYAAYISEDCRVCVESTKNSGSSWHKTLVNLKEESVDGSGSVYISFINITDDLTADVEPLGLLVGDDTL